MTHFVFVDCVEESMLFSHKTDLLTKDGNNVNIARTS